MSILQIKIDDEIIVKELKRKAAEKGLSMTAYVRMKLYEDIHMPILDIEEGLKDIKDGKVSPAFTDVDKAFDWLNDNVNKNED